MWWIHLVRTKLYLFFLIQVCKVYMQRNMHIYIYMGIFVLASICTYGSLRLHKKIFLIALKRFLDIPWHWTWSLTFQPSFSEDKLPLTFQCWSDRQVTMLSSICVGFGARSLTNGPSPESYQFYPWRNSPNNFPFLLSAEHVSVLSKVYGLFLHDSIWLFQNMLVTGVMRYHTYLLLNPLVQFRNSLEKATRSSEGFEALAQPAPLPSVCNYEPETQTKVNIISMQGQQFLQKLVSTAERRKIKLDTGHTWNSLVSIKASEG